MRKMGSSRDEIRGEKAKEKAGHQVEKSLRHTDRVRKNKIAIMKSTYEWGKCAWMWKPMHRSGGRFM